MEDNLVKVYTGSEVAVRLLKDELEDIGVKSILKDKFKSAISAGFASGVPSAIDLFIRKNDLDKVSPHIEEFRKRNE